ncbi:MAG: Spo0B domain-containing protein [Clostridia bacterium]
MSADLEPSMTPKKPSRTPDVQKTTLFAIVVNSIQIGALLIFVLCVTLTDMGRDNRFSLQLIAILGAIMASWGAWIDIQEALHTRKRERIINDLQTTNRQMDSLNLKLRAQRHDFLNHLQVVYSLMEMQEYQEASAYLERIYEQIRSVSKVLRTNMAAFNALVQVKSAACEERGIALELNIHSALVGLSIPSWELCCVIGNLLDNAMDAVADAAKPHIALTVSEDLRGFTFILSNNGKPISPALHHSIFEAGVSTKGEGHGLGLSIVRQTLAEYKGTIDFTSQSDETAFTISIPKEL